MIIHEYKHTVDPGLQKTCYQDALWQIYENNYLSHPLSASKTDKNIQKIIVRGLVIVTNDSNQSKSIYA